MHVILKLLGGAQISKIKKEEEEKNIPKTIYKKEDKTAKVIHLIVFIALKILFGLFILLSIISGNIMRNPRKMYYDVRVMMKSFEMTYGEKLYLNPSSEIIENILNIFNDYFYDKKVNFANYNFNRTQPFQMVTQTKLNIFFSKKGKCSNEFKNFINSTIKNKEIDDNCIEEYKHQKSEIINDFQKDKIIKYFENINDRSYLCKNNVTYDKYIASLFYNNKNHNIKYSKNNHIYNTKNAFTVHYSINYISKEIMNDTLYLISGVNPINDIKGKDYFSFDNTKAILIDFTLFNINRNYFYYVSLFYEISPVGGAKIPEINIIPFHPDLNILKNGKIMKIIDSFRLIFICAIIGAICHNFYYFFKYESIKNWIELLYIDNILDIASFIIYLIIFSKKMGFLYIKQKDLIEINGCKELPDYNYKNIAFTFNEIVIMEGILVTFLLFRCVVHICDLENFSIYFKYLRLSLYRSVPYFIIYFIFILIFAIFSHQLWGWKNENYNTFLRAFLSTLEFSVSHIQYIFDTTGKFENYEVVFVVFFYVLIIFFLCNMFYGIYTESYRLNVLQYGNVYTDKIKGPDDDKKKEIIKKDKNDEN